MIAPIVLVLRLAALAALYAFLGFALWVMWRELRNASESANRKTRLLRVKVHGKNERPWIRTFSQPEVIIGRGAASDLPLKDKSVSGRHARLSFHDGQWWVDDLGSRNGTRLNRERLQGSTVLTTGDEIKCGSATLLVTLPAEGGSSGRVWEGQDE